jgi:archaetidylinositol phosphate synthase
LLDRIRNAIAPIALSVGRGLSRTGLPPNFWTFLGLIVSAISGAVYAGVFAGGSVVAGLFLLVGGALDIVDGAVAKATNRVTKSGAFLDSVVDRVSEVAVFTGILASNIMDNYLVLLALAFSLLVSYTRARGESLGLALSGVGIGERPERIIALVAFSLLGLVYWGVIAVLVLSLVTFLQRVVFIIRRLA